MPHEFRTAWLKVQRAEHHFTDLDDLIRRFRKSQYHPAHIRHDDETGENALHLNLVGDVPDAIPLVFGDAVHNLRAALDHAAFDIMTTYRSRLNAEDRAKVKFPFERTRQKLEKAIQDGRVLIALEDCSSLAAVILDEIRPYPGGNDPIYALTQLDNADKHRLLITVLAPARAMIPLPTGGPHRADRTAPMPDEFRVKIPAPATLVLDESPFRGKAVIDALTQCRDAVAGALEALAMACPPRRLP